MSIASAWEISITVGPGKLSMDGTIEQLFSAAAARRISLLPIVLPHAIGVRDLADHHRDPFDRLLISQALCGQLHIVSVDAVFEAYVIQHIW